MRKGSCDSEEKEDAYLLDPQISQEETGKARK